MGKLTLNMLLSFAEFEREVASERVRDKMYATKTKGMWVGGTPPLGYDIKFKKLEPNENEIPQVKEIFETYLASTGLNQCRDIVEEKGIRGKQWTTKTGEVRGGGILSLKSVHNILRNATYIGKLPHKRTSEVFDGQHNGILDKELFDAVQKKLADNNICGDCPRSRGTPLLHQKVFAADGKRFVNKRGNKGQIKYRYYKNGKTSLPAGDIENIVRDTLKKFLNSDMSGLPDAARLTFKQVEFSDGLVAPMLEKVVYHKDKMTLFVKLDNLSYLAPFKNEKVNHSVEPMNGCYVSADSKHVILEKQIFINRFGMKSNRYIGSGISVLTKSENANNLIRAMAMGWRYRKMYETGKTINEIRLAENVADRTVYKYLNLAYLSPKVVSAVMNSEVPSHISLQVLFGIASKYEDFGEQEQAFFAA
jgi:DNA invertase Pin-like site-specific DNA recombinase